MHSAKNAMKMFFCANVLSKKLCLILIKIEKKNTSSGEHVNSIIYSGKTHFETCEKFFYTVCVESFFFVSILTDFIHKLHETDR